MMMEAAVNNRKGILKLLDSFGADINLVDHAGASALHYAYRYGYTQLGEYMVKRLGADDSIMDKQGRSCYQCQKR